MAAFRLRPKRAITTAQAQPMLEPARALFAVWRPDRSGGVSQSRSQARAGVPGNEVALLVDGEQVFAAMLKAFEHACFSICVETYIFAADRTGSRFLQALSDAALRGVRVHVLIDGVGSMGTSPAFFEPLRQAGGHLAVFHPLRLWGPIRALWRRDHRKLMVIDGRMGFIGGLNICDAHASVLAGGGGWHDMHAQVCGPAAYEMALLFAQTWRRAKNAGAQPPLLPRPEAQGAVAVQILDGLYRRRRSIRGAYAQAVRRSKHSIRICSAYFIPDRAFIRALQSARKRGVVVQILLAGATDVAMVQWASRSLYQKLLEQGVELFEWQAQVLHAKTMVCDGRWCCIGSYNMDRRSLLYNLEANMACEDDALGEALETQFFADIQGSKKVMKHVWHRRPMLQKVLERIFYFLRYWL